MLLKLWLIIKVCAQSLDCFMNKGYTYRASALAFTSLLTIVPLMFVIVFFVSIFPVFKHILLLGENYILQNFIPTSALTIEYYLHGFLQQATQLPTFSFLFLLVTTFMLVYTIEETLNEIWEVKPRPTSKQIAILLVYWILFLLIPILIGLGVFLSSYAYLLSWIVYADQPKLYYYLLAFLSLAMNTILFTLTYLYVPNSDVSLDNGFVGGILAALLFEFARFSFALYIESFPSYAVIYGAFAIIPIFLIWLYIFWSIVLYGALVTQGLEKAKVSSKIC